VPVLCALLPSDGVVSVFDADAQVNFFRLLPFLTFFSNLLFSRFFFSQGNKVDLHSLFSLINKRVCVLFSQQ